MQLTMDFDALNWTRITLHLETTDVYNHLEKNVRVSTVPGRMHQFHFGQIIYCLSCFAPYNFSVLCFNLLILFFFFILCSVSVILSRSVLFCLFSQFCANFDDLTQQKQIHNHEKNE